MKLKYKLLALLLSLSTSIPTFAVVQIPDTFTYSNITDTLIGGTNKYIIASDNTVMANGTSVKGLGTSAVNTGTLWKPIITGANAVTLNNVVKISNVTNMLFLNKDGDVYITKGYNYPKKIEVEGDVKFKDIGEVDCAWIYGVKYNANSIELLISEDGKLYRSKAANSLEMVLVEDVTNAESIYMTHLVRDDNAGSYNHILYANILTKNGEVYFVSYNGSVKKLNSITDVENIYPITHAFYYKFSSGAIGYGTAGSEAITQVDIPKGEEFRTIISNTSANILVTDKNVYKLTGTALTKMTAVNTVDKSVVNPVAVNSDLAIDNEGKYYTWAVSGTEVQFTPITGIDEWANENPVVLEEELAGFDVELNKIYRRYDTQEISFRMVSKNQPKAFNIYYCKNEDKNDRLKWQLIESNVPVSSLSPESYDTGYENANGPITGFNYKYNWQIGNEDLVGVHLIAEPVYE